MYARFQLRLCHMCNMHFMIKLIQNLEIKHHYIRLIWKHSFCKHNCRGSFLKFECSIYNYKILWNILNYVHIHLRFNYILSNHELLLFQKITLCAWLNIIFICSTLTLKFIIWSTEEFHAHYILAAIAKIRIKMVNLERGKQALQSKIGSGIAR